MRKSMSVFIILLVLGLSFSAAVSQSFVLAETQEDEAYEEFWDILNREAELIVELNSTSNESEILELAQELIQNSWNGSHNAAQISALIWQGLEELENSGVKTYYTAEELREMAQNITQNGLPNETVQLLKEQGWSDEEIQALQEYIAENAENITEDFNLTKFLKDFSQAFIQVGFKYNHYEAWALKKLANVNKPSVHLPYVTTWSEETEVPFIWDDFKEFNRTFSNASLDEKLNLTRSLKEKIANFITSGDEKILYRNYTILYAENASEYRKCFAGRPWLPIRRELNSTYSWLLRNLEAHQIDNMTIASIRDFLENFTSTDSMPIGVTIIGRSLKVIPQGDSVIVMIITWNSTMYFSSKDCSTHFRYRGHYDVYYWKGFEAYEKLSNLQTILEAKLLGNEDPTLDEMMENITQNLSEYFKTYKRGESEFGGSIISRLISPPNNPRPPKAKSSPMSGDEGHLYIDITVNNGHVTEDYATYRVRVLLQAEGNVVTDVNVEVEGTGLSDSTHYGMIEPGNTIEWYSRESDEVYGSGSVTVSGNVTVTYTPSCGDLPNSGSVPLTCNQPTTITEPYSVTINLTESTINPDKVQFRINPIPKNISVGNSVTFNIRVTNENDVPISGRYELHIEVPQGDGSTYPYEVTGSLTVSAHNSTSLNVTKITYSEPGTFHYSGSFNFEGYPKNDDGSVTVTENYNPSSGSLSIESVSISPQEPRDGDLVNLTVRVENTYDSNKIIKLKLYVDGSKVDEVTDSINGNSEETFTLHWFSEEGEHEWRIELYSKIGNNVWSYDDGDSGSIIVQSDDTVSCENEEYWTAWLEVTSTQVVGEGKVHIAVKASYCQALPDVGGGQISLLDLEGHVYIDGNEVDSFNTVNSGESLSIGETKVIDEFDWPMSVGNHTILLEVKNLSGLQENIETKTDSITVEILPSNNEYPLKLTDIWCDNIKFNFEASNHYTQGRYVSPLTCTFKFENIGGEPVYITELSTDISVSPSDLKKAIPNHTTVSVNEEIEPGEFIMIQIRDKAVTTDRQMLLRVDGTTAILYFNYIIEGIINGVSKIVSNGVDRVDVDVSVYQGTVYADMMGDVIIFIAGPKAEEDIVTKIPIITKLTKIPGVKQILGFLSLEPFKNAIVYGIDRVFGG